MSKTRVFSVLKTLGGCGGTIVSRALAANGAFVLSEVNPRAAQLFVGALNPLVQLMRHDPSKLSAAWREVDVHTLGAPEVFGRFMADLSDSLDRPLVIRDYSYVDYVGVPFVWPRPNQASLEPALQPFGAIRAALLIRHPAAAYRSLIQHPPLATVLTPELFIAGHIDFLRSNASHTVVRYEDFLSDPEAVIASLCGVFDITVQPSWPSRLADAPALTGNENAMHTNTVEPPTSTRDAALIARLAAVADYDQLLHLAGYQPMFSDT